MSRRNLGFSLKPNMTVGEMYREYARALDYEAWKFKVNDDRRLERWSGDPKKWLALQQAASRRFVEKIAAMINAMEFPE